VKIRIAIAVAIGAFASILFHILDAALHSRFLQSLALPGHIAIISIWGAHGMDSRSETIALIAGMSINAIVYSLIAFGLLKWFGHSIESRSPRDG
jgi:hypothetical protein